MKNSITSELYIKGYQTYLKRILPRCADQYAHRMATHIKNHFDYKQSIPRNVSNWLTDKSKWSAPLASVIRSFQEYVVTNKESYLYLKDTKAHLLNLAVSKFLSSRPGRLRSEYSIVTYKTVLVGFSRYIDFNLNLFTVDRALDFIYKKITDIDGFQSNKANKSIKGYRAVLAAFSNWAINEIEYTKFDKRPSKKGSTKYITALLQIGEKNFRNIASIKVQKDDPMQMTRRPLTEVERADLLKRANSSIERAVISLMSENGLRLQEVKRLRIMDCDFKERKLWVAGKGQQSSVKTEIHFMASCRKYIKKYLEEIPQSHIKDQKSLIFVTLDIDEMSKTICRYLEEMKLRNKNRNERYTAESLRNTAGQILYNKGLPLEYIHRTLRNRDFKATLKFAENSIKENYFERMQKW